MELLAKNKKVVRQQVGRSISVDPAQPLMFFLQREQEVRVMLGYPQVPLAPIQIIDPADPNVGKFYFMTGYSTVDGGDIYR